MKKIRIYLGGTIYNEAPDCNWKDTLKKLLPDDMYECFDPDPSEDPELYMVARDKAEISNCDVLVAYIQKPSFGTAMEIMYASLLHTKPIFVINPNGMMCGDLWLEAHSHLICSSVEDCAEHVKSMRF